MVERLKRLSDTTRVPPAVYLREALEDLLRKYASTLRKAQARVTAVHPGVPSRVTYRLRMRPRHLRRQSHVGRVGIRCGFMSQALNCRLQRGRPLASSRGAHSTASA
jgi:hypothetical protein